MTQTGSYTHLPMLMMTKADSAPIRNIIFYFRFGYWWPWMALQSTLPQTHSHTRFNFFCSFADRLPLFFSYSSQAAWAVLLIVVVVQVEMMIVVCVGCERDRVRAHIWALLRHFFSFSATTSGYTAHTHTHTHTHTRSQEYRRQPSTIRKYESEKRTDKVSRWETEIAALAAQLSQSNRKSRSILYRRSDSECELWTFVSANQV